MSMRSITSRQNPVVARFRALADTADPTGARVLLDGVHLVREAQDVGPHFRDRRRLIVAMASDSEEAHVAEMLASAGVDVVQAPDAVFDAMSPVRTPSGIVAIVTRRPSRASESAASRTRSSSSRSTCRTRATSERSRRTAEAGGMTGMFVSGASANPFSWKAIRGSMGSVLRLPVVGGMPTPSVMTCLRSGGIRTVAAVPRGGTDPDAVDWSGKVALVLGGEGAGLPDEVTGTCDARVSIPMAARVESLNVAAAGAILVYAARRQRGT